MLQYIRTLFVVGIIVALCPANIKGDIYYPNLRCLNDSRPSSLNTQCYLYVFDHHDFESAEAYCNNYNGHLARISDNDTNLFVAVHVHDLFDACVEDVWIGGRATNVSHLTTFSWTRLDSLMLFNNFGDLSSHDITNTCVYLNANNTYWYPSSCQIPRAFVCEVPMYTSRCESTWTYYNETDDCYKVYTDESLINFNDAEVNCTSQGGHLVSIHDDDENWFVSQLSSTTILQDAHQMTWIGYTSDSFGQFSWTDGSNSLFNKLFDGAYADYTDKCVSLFPDGDIHGNNVGGWKSQLCSSNYGRFICKKPSIKDPYFYE